jgi:hypothetical protein
MLECFPRKSKKDLEYVIFQEYNRPLDILNLIPHRMRTLLLLNQMIFEPYPQFIIVFNTVITNYRVQIPLPAPYSRRQLLEFLSINRC